MVFDIFAENFGVVQIPGQYGSVNAEFNEEFGIKMVGVEQNLLVFASTRRPKQISLLGAIMNVRQQ